MPKSRPHKVSPKSLQNLKKWQPGQSGNPAGPKVGQARISDAYNRYLKMDEHEFYSQRPKTAAEHIAHRQIRQAMGDFHPFADCPAITDPDSPLSIIKEITDRTEGKPRDHQMIFNIDVTKLTATQLERIASGEHPSIVVDTTQNRPAILPGEAIDVESAEVDE